MGLDVPTFPVLMGWGVPGVICLLQILACGGLSNSRVLVDHLGGAGAAILEQLQGGSLPFHP